MSRPLAARCLFALALAFGAPRPALAAARPLPDSSTIRAVKAFAEERGLPTRTVEAGPSWNRVTRLALPLTQATWQDLTAAIGLRENPTTGKFEGSLIFRGFASDMMVIAPPGYGFGIRVLDAAMAGQRTDWREGGVIVHLSPEQADHVGRWFKARSQDNLFRVPGNGCSDVIMNVEVEPGPDGTHSVRAVSDAEAATVARNRQDGKPGILGSGVKAGKNVAEHTGVRASKQGFYMLMKWIWSGNENVQVVLVHQGRAMQKRTDLVATQLPNGKWAERAVVKSVLVDPSFAHMTDAELLGPLHPHGVDGASRRELSLEARQRLADLEAQLRSAQAELASQDEVAGEALRQIDARLAGIAATVAYLATSPQPDTTELDREARDLAARRNALSAERNRPASRAEIQRRIAALNAEREALLVPEAR